MKTFLLKSKSDGKAKLPQLIEGDIKQINYLSSIPVSTLIIDSFKARCSYYVIT